MNLDYNLACSRFQICFNGQIEVGTKDPIKYYWQFSTKVSIAMVLLIVIYRFLLGVLALKRCEIGLKNI